MSFNVIVIISYKPCSKEIMLFLKKKVRSLIEGLISDQENYLSH